MISIAMDNIVTADGSAVTVLRVLGEVDVGTAPLLEEKIAKALDGGVPRLVIDLARVDFCDASGLRVLMSARKRCLERHGWIRLVGGRRIRRLLEVTDLLEALPCHHDLSHAMAAGQTTAPAPGGSASVTSIRPIEER
ncbi:MAG TPA: STAS domain-containing protein [Kineosporiaceae bacterium]